MGGYHGGGTLNLQKPKILESTINYFLIFTHWSVLHFLQILFGILAHMNIPGFPVLQVPKGDVTPSTGFTQGDAVHFLEFHSGKLVIRQNMVYLQFGGGATGGT